MSAVLLPSGYAETVGKPCPTCGGSAISVQAGTYPHDPCPTCIEGVVRERYVVVKARREWRALVALGELGDGSGWSVWTEGDPPSTDVELERLNADRIETRVVPVEPLGETDWYIATEQWLILNRMTGEREWSTQLPGADTAADYGRTESRFAITHVAHNVRELPVVERYEGGTVIQIGRYQRCLWRPGQMAADIPEDLPSDLAPGDLVLELTEPPVLLDEPITHARWKRVPGDYKPDRVPLRLALGVNRIELP